MEKEISILAPLTPEQREALRGFNKLIKEIMDREGSSFEAAMHSPELGNPYKTMFSIVYPRRRIVTLGQEDDGSIHIDAQIEQWLSAIYKGEDLRLQETDARGIRSILGRKPSFRRSPNLRIKTHSLEEIRKFFEHNAWGQEADYIHFYSHGGFPDQELVINLDNQELIEKYLAWVDLHMDNPDAIEKYLSGYALHCRFEMGRRLRDGIEKFEKMPSSAVQTRTARKYAPNLKYQEFHFQRFSEIWKEEKSQQIAFDILAKEFPEDIKPTAFDSFVVQFRKWNKVQMQKRK